jgi:hypothetical protein
MSNRHGIVTAFLIIAVGAGWLLNELQIFNAIDWAWTLILATGGIMSFVLGGINKVSVVAGPCLLAGAVTSALRQSGHLNIRLEMPILTIVFGTCLLIALVSSLKTPEIFKEDLNS